MSGNNVRMSIFMTGKRRTPNVQRCNAFSGSAIRVETDAYKLFHNLEDRPLAMARGRTGEQCANSVNGLASAANNPANVSSSKLQLKDRGSAAWNFCKNHVVRKFNQLADDKLEELSHAMQRLTTNPPSHNTTARQVKSNFLPQCSVRCPQRMIWQTGALRTAHSTAQAN